jgi:hypothetical protein
MAATAARRRLFVPLIYIVAGFSAGRRGVFASTAAARGRPGVRSSPQRSLRAARLAAEDQSVEATDVRVGYAAPGVDRVIDANTATGQFVVERDRYVDQ